MIRMTRERTVGTETEKLVEYAVDLMPDEVDLFAQVVHRLLQYRDDLPVIEDRIFGDRQAAGFVDRDPRQKKGWE